MNKEQKENVFKIVLTVVLIVAIKILDKSGYIQNEQVLRVLYIAPYFIVGFPVLKNAIKGILAREPFDECFLMSISTIGAFLLGEYSEAVFVMLFYQIGEFFGDFAVDKSEKNIKALMELRPEYASVFINDKTIVEKKLTEIKKGDIIVIKNGERIPLDGEIIDGTTMLNTSSLTGESIPRQVKIGDEILSGTLNIESTIKIKVNKEYTESTATKIIELVENASEKKSRSENFITEFARVYTPIVCLLALLVFVVPVVYYLIASQIAISKINLSELANQDNIMVPGIMLKEVIQIWLYRALTMLVISCPCALVVSIPLAFFSSIGKASKKGILIKGSNYIENIANLKTVIFDKTGTMTKGVFEVVGVHNENEIDSKKIIEMSAYAEFYSNHPIAKCIKKECEKKIEIEKIKECKEIGGYGISAIIDGKKVLVGSSKLMEENNIDYRECNHIDTIVHVSEESKYLGHIVIDDKIKDTAKQSVSNLRKVGVEKIVMLTGDLKNVGESVANEIGMDEVYTELLPANKVSIIEKFLDKYKQTKKKIAFVGDGINDAATLVRSDVGFSMGTIGSDSAVEASDVVLMDDNPNKVYESIKISKKTMLVSYEIIIFTIVIKIAFLLLSALGMANMWFATFADVGVLIICVLNAIRLLI